MIQTNIHTSQKHLKTNGSKPKKFRKFNFNIPSNGFERLFKG